MKTTGLLLSLLTLLLAPPLCYAQWRTQTIQLQPGWNAVHLEVQPEPDVCDTIFANLPVESVWKWNRRFSSIQFVRDPATLLPKDPDWLVWLPRNEKGAFLRRLRSLQANQSYLIKVATTSSPITLTIKGQVHPQCRILIVTQHDSPAFRHASEAAGAFGYVLKEDLDAIAGIIAEQLRPRTNL